MVHPGAIAEEKRQTNWLATKNAMPTKIKISLGIPSKRGRPAL